MRKYSMREKALVGTLVLLASGLAYYNFVLSPLMEQRQTLVDNISQLEIQTFKLEAVELPAVQAEIAEMQDKLHREVVSEGSLSYALVYLEDHAEKSNVLLDYVSINGVTLTGGGLHLSVQGTYDNFRLYLKALQNGSSSVVIQAITLTPQPDQAQAQAQAQAQVHAIISATLRNGRIEPVNGIAYPRTSPFSP